MTSSCSVENVPHGSKGDAGRLAGGLLLKSRRWRMGCKVPGLCRNYKPNAALLLYINKLDVECKENIRVKDYLKVLDLTN